MSFSKEEFSSVFASSPSSRCVSVRPISSEAFQTRSVRKMFTGSDSGVRINAAAVMLRSSLAMELYVYGTEETTTVLASLSTERNL